MLPDSFHGIPGNLGIRGQNGQALQRSGTLQHKPFTGGDTAVGGFFVDGCLCKQKGTSVTGRANVAMAWRSHIPIVYRLVRPIQGW